MTRFESVADAVGGTPLIRLTRSAAGLRPRVYVKLEASNPGGSVKDRAALAMIRAAETDGTLRPGGTVVETTSGNTGIGLALFAAQRGYRCVVFTSSATSREKRALLAAYGAEVRLVDVFVPKAHPDSLASAAERFVAETPGAWLAGQYDNPANPEAHRLTTGPEIWADTEGAITHVVATVGTGGTISGTGDFLKQASGGRVRVIGADPATSTYSGGDGSAKYVEGAGHFVHPDAEQDPWPQSFDPGVVDEFLSVDDRTAIEAIHRLARLDGILAGGSSGVALAAAFQLAERLDEDDVIVVLLPDSGRAYLSSYFDEGWLLANGFRDEATNGPDGAGGATVQDVTAPPTLLNRGLSVRAAITGLEASGTAATDPLLVAYARERRAAPHPGEIVGWTTLGALREAAAAGVVAADAGLAVREATVADLARPLPSRVGAGLVPESALRAAADTDAGWAIALVLRDGRVAGTVSRRALIAAAASGRERKTETISPRATA